MLPTKCIVIVSVFMGILLAGCDAIEARRNDNAFVTLYAASYNFENGLKIQYCLNSGKVSYYVIYRQPSIQEALKGKRDYTKILKCYSSTDTPANFAGDFKSYKSLYLAALARREEVFRNAADKEAAVKEIAQIKSNYVKFIGVSEERPEIAFSRDQYLKYQYCIVNPAYRDSLDLKLRAVDKVQNPLEIKKCIRTIEKKVVVSINNAIADRLKQQEELALQQAMEQLSGK